MSPKAAEQLFQAFETEMESRPSGMDYQLAYQARVAIDRIRFAIKETERFSRDFDQLREIAFQLMDALDRLESADRHFQKRFRDWNSLGHKTGTSNR